MRLPGSAWRKRKKSGCGDVACEALRILQDGVAEVDLAAVGTEGGGVTSCGVGHSDFGSCEDVVGGPDDFAVGDARELGPEAELERRISGVSGDVDKEHRVGTVGVVDIKQFVDEDDRQLVDGADLARTGDFGQLVTRERDDFEAAGAGELTLADGIELEQGFFGGHGAAGDGEDNNTADTVGNFGGSFDVGRRVKGSRDGAVAFWKC